MGSTTGSTDVLATDGEVEARRAVPGRVWGATLLSGAARQWGSVCTLLALAYLARTLGPADFGRYTFWLAVLALLDVVVDCGTSTAVVQRGATEPGTFGAALAAARRVRAVAAVLAGAAVAVGAALLDERELGWIALAALAPLSRVPETSALVFQRDIAWGVPLAVRAGAHTLRLAAVVVLAAAGTTGFGPFLAAHAGCLALGNLALHVAARRRLPPRAAPLAGLLAAALPLAATAFLQQTYFWADNAFVRALAGDVELGRYNAAVRLFVWLAFFPAFATTAALPWLARSAPDGTGPGTACARLALPLFLAACAAAGALAPLGPAILALVYGPDFVPAASSLTWLLGALVAVSLGAPLLTAVVAAGRSRAALGIAAGALGVNLVANALLVPAHGGAGAAAGTLVTEGSVALLAWLVLRGLGQRPLPPARLLLLGAPLAALAWFVSHALVAAFPLA